MASTVHCGEKTLKDIHKNVNGAPNLNRIEFNDLTHCDNCLKVNITKSPAARHSLCESLTTPYQGLYVDFGFPDCISKDKDGNIIESSWIDIEVLNGEQAWILICDSKTRMLHGDKHLSK